MIPPSATPSATGPHRAGGVAPNFWARVDKSGDCWLWTGSTNSRGYGTVSIAGQSVGAHRYAYEQLVGPIPAGLEIDHLCRVRNCVNPEHLEPVTHRVNGLRSGNVAGLNAAKTHCPQGHAYDEANTYIRPDNGARCCRACRRAVVARNYARKVA